MKGSFILFFFINVILYTIMVLCFVIYYKKQLISKDYEIDVMRLSIKSLTEKIIDKNKKIKELKDVIILKNNEIKKLSDKNKKVIELIKKNSYGWKTKYFDDDFNVNELLEILK